MCGRGRLSSNVSEIKLVFSIPPKRPAPGFAASWDVAPTANLPIGATMTGPGSQPRFDAVGLVSF